MEVWDSRTRQREFPCAVLGAEEETVCNRLGTYHAGAGNRVEPGFVVLKVDFYQRLDKIVRIDTDPRIPEDELVAVS